MAQKKNILLIPEDWNGYIDPAVDEVRVDETVETPKVTQEYVSEAGDGVLDRDLVTREKRGLLEKYFEEYQTAKESNDPAGQIDALEKAVAHMWDVVSGDDFGSASFSDEKTA